jgi:pyridoxamine 5'-phosphate oxidase
MADSLADLRQTYKRASLGLADVDQDPFKQFETWFEAARTAELLEPNAFTLATCGAHMRPAARTVLLKGMQPNGFVFYTNFDSRKGQEMAENPQVAMQFLWLPLERQVRIEGRVELLDTEIATAYFQSRPRESQIGAWASPQSQPITGRGVLETNERSIAERFREEPVLPKPPHWGGYVIVPDYFEFWQGRPSRLHDRLAYQLVDGAWVIERLAP